MTMNERTKFAIRLLAVAAVSLFGLGLGVVGAGAIQSSQRVAGDPALDAIPQSAHAEAAGVTLRAESAVFSGTETLIQLRAEAADPNVRIAFHPDDFAGPFAEGTLTATSESDGAFTLRLPPLADSETYDTEVALTLGSLLLSSGRGPQVVEGPWTLELVAPPADQVRETLATEVLDQGAFQIEDISLQMSGTRSASETIVEMDLPKDVVLPAPPAVAIDGELIAPSRANQTQNGLEFSFPPTPFGEPVRLHIQSIAVQGSGEDVRVTVDLTSPVAEAPTNEIGERHFALNASHVVAGDDDRVLRGVSGVDETGSWVGVTFRGTWPLELGEPVVRNREGTPLVFRGMGVGYSKGTDGTIHPGETTIEVFVRDPESVGPLSFDLGPPVEVISGDYSVELGSRGS